MKKIISVCLAIMLFVSGLSLTTNASSAPETISIDVLYDQANARTMLNMINELRKPENAWHWNSSNTSKEYNKNLQDLVYDYKLEEIAMQRAAEIAVYYSHNRPDGSLFSTAYDVSVSACGENIAMGYKTVEEVFEAWAEENEQYAGQGHRRNMLNDYTCVAIGHVIYNNKHFWVQEFGNSTFSTEETIPCNLTKSVDILIDYESSNVYSSLGFDSSAIYAIKDKELRFEGAKLTLYSYTSYTTFEASPKEKIQYEIDNPSIARIENGNIIGITEGETYLTASLAGRTATIDIIVIENKESIPLCTHENTAHKTKVPSTCIDRGFEAGVYCNDCNTYISGHETIPILSNHNVEKNTVSDYTYFQCTVCKKCFSDTEGKNEVSRTNTESEIVKRTATVSDSGNLAYGDTWTLYSDGTLIIEGNGEMSFGSSVFSEAQYIEHAEKIKKVIICDGMTTVAFYAFNGYTALETVILGNTITKINCSAFTFCENLSEINFPASLRTIRGEWSDHTGVFEGCTNLKNVYLNEGLTYLGEYAFCDSGVQNLYIPDSLEQIGTDADGGVFYNCKKLESVFIPKGTKRINVFSFYYCDNLNDIVFEDASSLEYVSQQVFDGTAYFNNAANWKNDILYLDSILLAAGKREGYSNNNFNPENKHIVFIPEGITLLAENSFWLCQNVKHIYLPESLQTICENSFYRCVNLSDIYIPSNVRSIGSNAFYRCEKLETVQFGKNSQTEKIGSSAFDECTSLKEIILPEKLKEISSALFDENTSLESIVIPENVQNIGSSAFAGCVSLMNITFMSEDTFVSNTAFTNTAWYDAQPDGILYLNTTCLGIKGDDVPKTIEIKDETKYVADYAFACDRNYFVSEDSIGYSSTHTPCAYEHIEKVILPDSVTSIGKAAFIDCNNLKEIKFSENLENIDIYAFYKCANLSSVRFPESLISIGSHAFDSTGLTSVEFPKNVEKIGNRAFDRCAELSEISFKKADALQVLYGNSFADTKWENNQRGQIYIGSIHYCYNGYASDPLKFEEGTTIIATDSLSCVYDYSTNKYRGLMNAGNITNVFIPSTIKTISKSAFSAFSNLENVYYNGSEEQWKAINIEDDNLPLLNATIYYKASGIIGDINGDGVLTASDARTALRLSVNLDTLNGLGVSLSVVDINADGLISAADARLILRKSVGLES